MIVNYKKSDPVPQLTKGQKSFESLHRLSKIIIIQAVQASTEPCPYILNTCTALNFVTVLKFDMLN